MPASRLDENEWRRYAQRATRFATKCTIAVANMRGGVAKTTSAVHLAAGLSRLGHSVLLVDLDEQADATHMAGFVPGEHQDRSLVQVLEGTLQLKEVLLEPAFGGALAPSNRGMWRAEQQLLKHEDPVRAIYILNDILDRVEFEFVVLDCPTPINGMMLFALVAASSVVIPTDLTLGGLRAVLSLRSSLDVIQERHNRRLRLLGVLGTRDRRTVLHADALQVLRRNFRGAVFDTVIPESHRFQEAEAKRKTLFDIEPRHRGATAYAAWVQEVLERVAE